MNLSGLLPLIEQLDAFKRLTSELRDHATTTADVIESARAPLLAALSRARSAPIVVLTARTDRAKQIASELNAWSPSGVVIASEAKQSPNRESGIASSHPSTPQQKDAAPLRTLLAMTSVFDFPE
ncbi:MAG: hypothetical protein AB1817_08130, partial [Chloroflexota bacterium]